MKYSFKIFAVSTILLATASCKKFVEVPPPSTHLIGASVYSSEQTAAAAVTGMLETMAGNSIGGGGNGISALAGLSADEFALYPGAYPLLEQVYVNAQLSTNPPTIWSDLYNVIYQANAAITGISQATAVTASMKQQLIGEAQFVRAFCYFYLVNLYGDVPLVLTPTYQTNEGLSRTAQADVYAQIIRDLEAAQKSLSSNYLTPSGATTTERVRPNALSASALLARVYLYSKLYGNAEAAATTVISNANYSLVKNLDSAFLANNTEAIWQLEMPNTGFNTPDGSIFNLANFGGPSASYPFILSDPLVQAFEPGDLRQIHWTNSMTVNGNLYYYPTKYKLYYTGEPPAEFPTVLRLAEMYLIRSEARAMQGKLTGPDGALVDLNIIRQRAGLNPSTAVAQSDVLAAILNERRVEFFSEYGHRWLDLKRIEAVNSTMSVVTPLKGGTWKATDDLWPIPQADIKADAKLTQNPGY